MDDRAALTTTRRRLKTALWCTTPAAVLMLGISVVNGPDTPKPRTTWISQTSGGSGGGGSGGGAWATVSDTLTTQTGRSAGVGWGIFERRGRYEAKERSGSEDAAMSSRAPRPPVAADLAPADVPMPPAAPIAPSPPGIVAQMPGASQPGQPTQAELSAGDVQVQAQPVSTFAVDVDTSSYSRARQTILSGGRPNPADVRIEEMVNYFRYDLPPAPSAGAPFSVTTDIVTTPWNAQTRLMRVALNGHVVPRTARAPANIVLLVDVSGSMDDDSKLGLVKRAFSDMVDNLGPRDRVSIVSYASGAQVVLPSTSNRQRIKNALASLQSGGGTAGQAGLAMAYDQARQARIPGGINRVMIASDGDFNVGASDIGTMKAEIERQRRDGITLTTLGVGGQGSGSFNDGMMETLADAGNGNAAYLDDDLEARKVLRNELESSVHMIAKDVKAQVEFNPQAVRSYRLVGYQNRRLAEAAFDDDAVDAGEIGSGHQVTALYEITPAATIAPTDVASRRRYEANKVRQELLEGRGGAPEAPVGEAMFVKIRYKLPNGEQSRLIQRVVPASALATAQAPSGDTAFAIAVAAFGSNLAGVQPASFGPDQIIALAGPQTDQNRVEFIDMVRRFGSGVAAPVQTYTPPPPVVSPDILPPVEHVYVETNPPRTIGAWLALISGILAAWLALVDYRLARLGSSPEARRRDETGLGSRVLAVATPEGRSVDVALLSTALRAARVESSTETDAHLAAFEFAAHRAVKAASVDADIVDEVEAIVTRHAPGYLDQYVTARRRATHNQIEALETSLRQTVDTLTTRLRGLLDAQSSRDVDRVSDHEAFIHQRHGQPGEALA